MFGKSGSFLPNIGNAVGRARVVFCQTLAKCGQICQTLAKQKNRAANAARPQLFSFLSSLFTARRQPRYKFW
jgi:hypothetical protein